ncbi:unnamed protein product, partial [Laminaria digitata]
GNGLCLEAFTVALNQACWGGDKSWYVSTMRLQLGSLDFCKACRAVATLHVQIRTKRTPRGIWPPRTSPAQPPIAVVEPCVGSRVPVVKMLAATWKVHTEFNDKRLSEDGEVLYYPSNMNVLDSVLWPISLRKLSFGDDFDQPIDKVVWPALLQSLFLGDCFTHSINEVTWPASLRELFLGESFNKDVDGVCWPASLRELHFGVSFNQDIAEVAWPDSLRELSLGDSFNQRIVEVVWPPSLRSMSFGEEFNQAIAGVMWPASLQQLSFGKHFNEPIAGVAWPAS